MSAIGFLGTGIMGFPMARNLAQAGFTVRAWNRTRAKAEPLAEHGVTLADTAAEAAQGADVVITMLTDADAVAAAMEGDDGGLAGMGDDTVWAQMSTVGIAGTERLLVLARDRGVGYVDAPVLGTKQPAEEGKLVVLASGAPELRDRVDPVFDVVGSRTLWTGDEPGRATRLKLVANHWVVGLVETLAETIAFAGALGIDPPAFLDAISGGAMDAPYVQLKGRAMIEENFAPSFPLRLAHKDIHLVLDAARDAGIDLPVLAAADRQFERAIELGLGDADLAATFKAAAR